MMEAHSRLYDAIKEHDTVDADGDGAAARRDCLYPLPIGFRYDGELSDNLTMSPQPITSYIYHHVPSIFS